MAPLLTPLGVDDVSDRARSIFEDFLRERGNVPNMFRTLAHHPALLETLFAHFRAVMAPGAVSTRVKECVAVAVSAGNECEYCLASHTKLARQFGVPEPAIQRILTGGEEGLDPLERAAVRLGRAMARGGKGIPREATEAVRALAGDRGLLEVVAVAGLFHYFNRFNNALEVEVTR